MTPLSFAALLPFATAARLTPSRPRYHAKFAKLDL